VDATYRKTDTHTVAHTMEPCSHTPRKREREGGKDLHGYSSSNGETILADAKAGDASRCHSLVPSDCPNPSACHRVNSGPSLFSNYSRNKSNVCTESWL